MLVPSMYDMAEVLTQSGYTEEEVFDCGISGQIAFVVVVPEIGACRVPPVALSHFMAGADDYTADGMPEHWSNQPSGPWTIRRDRLRILADSWERHSDQCHTLADALDRQQADDEAATLRAPPPSTRTPGFYTLEEAARAIAAQEGFNAFQEDELRKDLLVGDHDGSLTVRDGGGHRKFAPIRPSIPRDFVELVTPTDVNNWAIHKGFQWRWQTEAQAAPVVTPEPTAAPMVAQSATTEAAGPLPLTTGDVAFSFAGLRWDEQGWKKPLGDRPKWLEACVVIPGQRGVSETRWNPVCIGAALARQGHVDARRVRAAFQTKPLLAPWLDAWKTYEADYLDND